MAESTKRTAASARDEDADESKSANGEVSRRKPAQDDRSIAAMVGDHAKSLFREQVSQRAGRPAADLGKLAKALHLTSEQLDDNVASPYVAKAAAQLERFSNFLETAKGEDALRGVERFAREKPLLFLGGAALIGFGGARFLKSTAADRSIASPAGSTSAATKPRSQRAESSARRGA